MTNLNVEGKSATAETIVLDRARFIQQMDRMKQVINEMTGAGHGDWQGTLNAIRANLVGWAGLDE